MTIMQHKVYLIDLGNEINSITHSQGLVISL